MPDEFQRFRAQHGVRTATCMYLRDGVLWYAAKPEGSIGITWRPRRADHPDAPELVTDSFSLGLELVDGENELSEQLRKIFDSSDTRELIAVTIEREAAPSEVDAVQRAFDDAGLPAVVSANYGRHSALHPDWVVIIEVQLGVFAAGLVAKAGADAWDAMRGFVERLYAERRKVGHEKGSITFDEGSRRVYVTDALPPDAYRAMADLGERGEYFWDAERGAWRKL